MRPDEYISRIEFYDSLTEDEKKLVADSITLRHYSADELIHSHNGQCIGLICVLSGSVRVSIISEEGRQLTLYKLEEGDTCVMSAACVLHEIRLESAMTASGDTTVLVLNSKAMAALVSSNLKVRCYCYEMATRRFSAALFVLQEIILTSFDRRLARFLAESSRKSGSLELKMTQEMIATEVSSAREVVARMLKQFVLDDLVELKRGVIVIKDLDGLSEIAEGM